MNFRSLSIKNNRESFIKERNSLIDIKNRSITKVDLFIIEYALSEMAFEEIDENLFDAQDIDYYVNNIQIKVQSIVDSIKSPDILRKFLEIFELMFVYSLFSEMPKSTQTRLAQARTALARKQLSFDNAEKERIRIDFIMKKYGEDYLVDTEAMGEVICMAFWRKKTGKNELELKDKPWKKATIFGLDDYKSGFSPSSFRRSIQAAKKAISGSS